MAKLKRPETFVYEDLPELVAARHRLAEIERELTAAGETRERLTQRRDELQRRVTELEVRQLAGEQVNAQLATARAELEQVQQELEAFPARMQRLRGARQYLNEQIRQRLEPENRRRLWRELAPLYAEAARELDDALAKAQAANERLQRLLVSVNWDVPPDWPQPWREFVTERGVGYVNPSRYDVWRKQLEEFRGKWT